MSSPLPHAHCDPQHPFPPQFRALKPHHLQLKSWQIKDSMFSGHLPRQLRIYGFCQWDPPAPYLEGRRKTARSGRWFTPSAWADFSQELQWDSHIYCQLPRLLIGMAVTSTGVTAEHFPGLWVAVVIPDNLTRGAWSQKLDEGPLQIWSSPSHSHN